jgi:hypothetical protein
LTNWPSVWVNRPGEHIKSPGPSDRQRVRGRTSHRRGVMNTRPAPEAPGGYKARQIPIRGKKQNPPALTSRRACGSDARVCDNRPAVWPTLCARLADSKRTINSCAFAWSSGSSGCSRPARQGFPRSFTTAPCRASALRELAMCQNLNGFRVAGRPADSARFLGPFLRCSSGLSPAGNCPGKHRTFESLRDQPIL